MSAPPAARRILRTYVALPATATPETTGLWRTGLGRFSNLGPEGCAWVASGVATYSLPAFKQAGFVGGGKMLLEAPGG